MYVKNKHSEAYGNFISAKRGSSSDLHMGKQR